MAKQVHKFTFTQTGHKQYRDSGLSEKCLNPYRMLSASLPSGARVVMANIDRLGHFCLWIEGDFESNKKLWNTKYFAAYFTGKHVPGNAHHVGSTVDDGDGSPYHCYDITEWVEHQ